MPVTPGPLTIKDCSLITLSTGLRSQNLLELRDRIRQAPLQSIYHHFYEGMLRPSFDDVEYRNDFAVWAHRVLRDSHLAERIGQIHPLQYTSLEDLRDTLLDVIEDRLYESETIPWAPRGQEFYFLSAKVVIFDTSLQATTPSELPSLIETLTPGSIYFHFIEAHRRKPLDQDDFSAWLKAWGSEYDEICDQLKGIDYHFFNLGEIRGQILSAMASLGDPSKSSSHLRKRK